ncbi:hypothetical protein [Clostridium estertheticum]|nr:hypothetical protein [Clostridium estertheticum]
MNYITTKKAAKIWEITGFVYADTEKPADGRYRSSKVKDGENK